MRGTELLGDPVEPFRPVEQELPSNIVMIMIMIMIQVSLFHFRVSSFELSLNVVLTAINQDLRWRGCKPVEAVSLFEGDPERHHPA